MNRIKKEEGEVSTLNLLILKELARTSNDNDLQVKLLRLDSAAAAANMPESTQPWVNGVKPNETEGLYNCVVVRTKGQTHSHLNGHKRGGVTSQKEREMNSFNRDNSQRIEATRPGKWKQKKGRSLYQHGRSRSDLHKWERWQAPHQSHPWLWTSLIVFQDKWQERKEQSQESWPQVNSLTAACYANSDSLTLILPLLTLQKNK